MCVSVPGFTPILWFCEKCHNSNQSHSIHGVGFLHPVSSLCFMVINPLEPIFGWWNPLSSPFCLNGSHPVKSQFADTSSKIAGSWTCCRRRLMRSAWADSRASCARWRRRCNTVVAAGVLWDLEKNDPCWLGWLEHDGLMTFHILGIVIPTDFHIFQGGIGQPPISPCFLVLFLLRRLFLCVVFHCKWFSGFKIGILFQTKIARVFPFARNGESQ